MAQREMKYALVFTGDSTSARQAAKAVTSDIAAVSAAAKTAEPKMQALAASFAGLDRVSPARSNRSADIAEYGKELDRLQARFDPLFAAQQRYSKSLADIAAAQNVGAISASRAIDLRVREKASFDALTSSIERANVARKQAVEAAVGRVTVSPDRSADVGAFFDQRDQLRARFNPVFGVLTQYKQAVEEIRQANRVGAISTDEMTAAIGRQRRAALATVQALKGQNGQGGGMLAGNDNWRRGNLIYQGFDIGQGLLAGMPLQQIAVQQGPQVLQLYAGQGGMNAALKDFSSLAKGAARAITPMTVGIAGATVAVLAGAKAWNDYLSSTKAVETAAAGIGRAVAGSAGEMEAAARAGAAAAGISITAARQMEAGFLSTGKVGSQNFERLISLSRDFAATIGIDAGDAGKALADMFADPAKAADTLSRQYGLIDAATAKRARDLAEQNRLSEAQAVLLDALPGKLADAEQATTALGRAWQSVATAAGNAWDAIGGAIDEAISGPGIDEQIKKLEERLSSSHLFYRDRARDQAELDRLRQEQQKAQDAREKALADQQTSNAVGIAEASPATATEKRINELRNSIQALQLGRDGATGDQRVAIDKTIDAQTRTLDALINKRVRMAELDRLDIAIANERNPLLRAELEARRTRIQLADKEISTSEIEAEAARARSRVIEETIAGARTQISDIQSETAIRKRLSDQVAAGTISATDANRMLQEELQLRPLVAAAAMAEGAEKARLQAIIANLTKAYEEQAEVQKLEASREAIRSREENIQKLQMEIALVGQSEAAQRRLLAVFVENQRLQREGIALNSEQADTRRKLAAQEADLTTVLDRQKDAWKRYQSAGESAIDSIFDGLTSGDPKAILDNLVKDLTSTLTELAVKNPLKNALFGTNYGTLGDLFNRGAGSAVSSIFGGQSVGAMNVSAGTVVVNGGISGGLGGLFGGTAANSNGFAGALSGSTALTSQGGIAGQIWNYFAAKGFQPHQIAGILGNVAAESNFNPLAIGDAGNAFGLFQHNDRAPALLSFLGGRQNLGNVQGQLDFVWKELQTTEKGALQRLLASTDVRSATAAFGGFERPQGWSPGNPEAMSQWTRRLSFAEEAAAKFGNTVNTTSTNLGDFGTKALSQVTGAAGTAAQGLGTLGNGLNNFGTQLGNIAMGQGSGGGGGFFSSLLGGIGSFFGGVSPTSSFWAPNTSLGSFIVNGFDTGGYTGPGGKLEPAGIAHRGEVIWSQDDVARAGGVAVVEGMRLGLRGYAMGGVVTDGAGGFVGMRNLAANGNATASAPISIAINNNSSAKVEDVQETSNERGGRHISFTIADEVGAAIGKKGGGAKKQLETGYGLRARGVRR